MLKFFKNSYVNIIKNSEDIEIENSYLPLIRILQFRKQREFFFLSIITFGIFLQIGYYILSDYVINWEISKESNAWRFFYYNNFIKYIIFLILLLIALTFFMLKITMINKLMAKIYSNKVINRNDFKLEFNKKMKILFTKRYVLRFIYIITFILDFIILRFTNIFCVCTVLYSIFYCKDTIDEYSYDYITAKISNITINV